MQQFIEFSLHHWELWLAFLIVLILLIFFELHGRLTGLPQLSHHHATLLINRQDAIILDIRDANSFAQGHIAGAINIPYDELSVKINKLANHKERPILIIPNTAQPQTKQAGVLLKKNGYHKIHTLRGGIATWQNAGLPLVKGN